MSDLFAQVRAHLQSSSNLAWTFHQQLVCNLQPAQRINAGHLKVVCLLPHGPYLQARRLESEIDARLAAYSKLGDAIALAATSSAATVPDPQEASLTAKEIEGLLQQLAEINEAMSARGQTASAGAVNNHTVVRHQNILIEYTRVRLGRVIVAQSLVWPSFVCSKTS